MMSTVEIFLMVDKAVGLSLIVSIMVADDLALQDTSSPFY